MTLRVRTKYSLFGLVVFLNSNLKILSVNFKSDIRFNLGLVHQNILWNQEFHFIATNLNTCSEISRKLYIATMHSMQCIVSTKFFFKGIGCLLTFILKQ